MAVVIHRKIEHTHESYERAKQFFPNRIKKYRQKIVSKKDHHFFDGWSADEIGNYCRKTYGNGVYWVFTYGGQPPIQTLYMDHRWKRLN